MILLHDAKAIVLSFKSHFTDPKKRESIVTAEIMSIPHLQFLEVILKTGTAVSIREEVDIGRLRPKVESVRKKLKYPSLSRGSRKVLKAWRESEVQCRKLAEEIATSPLLVAELGWPLEESIRRSLGPSADDAEQTSRKLAGKVLMRYIDANLSGNQKSIHEIIIRAIYGPLAKESELKGLYYQH